MKTSLFLAMALSLSSISSFAMTAQTVSLGCIENRWHVIINENAMPGILPMSESVVDALSKLDVTRDPAHPYSCSAKIIFNYGSTNVYDLSNCN